MLHLTTTPNGAPVDREIFGAWGFCEEWVPGPDEDQFNGVQRLEGAALAAGETALVAALNYALDHKNAEGKPDGPNHIDSAWLYGRGYTDQVIGRVLAGRDPDSLIVGGKLWGHQLFERPDSDSPVSVAVQQMLKRLHIPRLGIAYIHHPFGDRTDVKDPYPPGLWETAIPQLCQLIDRDRVATIGLSNFTQAQVERAVELADGYPIGAVQTKFNVLDHGNVDPGYTNLCEEIGAWLIAHQPVERGQALTNPTVMEVAAKRGITPAQVCLSWVFSKGNHVAAAVKAGAPAHFDENLAAQGIILPPTAVERLDQVAGQAA